MVELQTEIGRRPLAKTGDHVHQHPERWPGAQQGKRLGRPRPGPCKGQTHRLYGWFRERRMARSQGWGEISRAPGQVVI